MHGCAPRLWRTESHAATLPDMSADAIVVLGGRPNRLPVGLRLLREGEGRVLIVFNATGHGDEEHLYVRPDPYTTRGEARAVAKLAREHGWRSIVVVTSTYHVPRARLIFRRAFDGELRMASAPPTWWRLPFDVVSELVKALYALTLRRSP
jgi:uncharacterized SAM-binding protein YcdF (DUF218 family)